MVTDPNDPTITLQSLQDAVHAFAVERDWLQFHSPKNLSMAIAAEAGELLEHFLWATPEQSESALEDEDKYRGVAEEVADVAILLMQFANVAGINLAEAVQSKLQTNAQKYPVAKARGRANKYTEL